MIAFRQIRARWRPPADVYRVGSGWIVKLDLAGVAPADVDARLDGRYLVVTGVRRDRLVQRGSVPYAMEISYSGFQREFVLPDRPRFAIVEIAGEQGMLLIHVRAAEDVS